MVDEVAKRGRKKLGYQGKLRPESVEVRSHHMSQIFPMVSLLRSAKDPEANVCAGVLQTVVRDLDRLNDIEMLCVKYNSETLRPLGGPAEEFFDDLNKILVRS